jgi:hypothetical protein
MFFEPIRHLASSCNKQGYGFAIMALCSLLIETIQCYRYGLPSTNSGELERLGIPKEQWRSGSTAFNEFFLGPCQHLFPDVDAVDFYSNIRNGLLHQAQTKGGWKIRTGQAAICNLNDKIIDRDKFANALEGAFQEYLEDLGQHDWAEDIWSKAAQKICWLVKTSNGARP